MKWPVIEQIRQIIFQKELQALKKTERKKRQFMNIQNLDSARFEGTNRAKDCTLIFVEGDSAKTYVVSGLSSEDRNYCGIYKLRGKLLNTRNASIPTIAKNEVIQDVVNSLGLRYDVDYSKDENFKTLRYGRVMIITDADEDGFHICGLLHNLFETLFPSLYQRKIPFVQSMYTPIARVFQKGKKDIIFYDLQEFEKYKQEHANQKLDVKYYKGLASSTVENAHETYGKKIVEYIYDEEAKENMNKAFLSELTALRKEWVGNYTVERAPVAWHGDGVERCSLTLTSFIDNELIKFSRADCARSLPNVMDGLKECQRKTLYVAFKTNQKYSGNSVKVAQFGARVAELSEYHHGENNLSPAIVKMAQNFAGSNNIPLLFRDGQFGSRQGNGADAGQPRYIFTKLDMCTEYIFRAEDNCVLEYRTGDEGTPIEPKFYVPIIPMILVNGAQGIGTGWSTDVPCFDPKDVIQCVKMWIRNEAIPKLTPWYHGFKGTIVPTSDAKVKFDMNGRLNIANDRSYFKVIELPVSMSITAYKEFLDKMVESNEITAYHNNSTANEPLFTIYPAEGKSELTFKTLKLTSNISTTNMVAFDEEAIIRRYADTTAIIRNFCEVRLEYYVNRKAYMVKEFGFEINKLRNKVRFLREVVAGEFELFHDKIPKEVEQLEKELEEEKFERFDGDYSYLLGITIRGMTKSNVDRLEEELKRREKELEELESTPERVIWMKELGELEVVYAKYLQEVEALQAKREEPKKKGKK